MSEGKRPGWAVFILPAVAAGIAAGLTQSYGSDPEHMLLVTGVAAGAALIAAVIARLIFFR
jgi:hypothetical protein